MLHAKNHSPFRPFILAAGIACLVLTPRSEAADLSLTETDLINTSSFNTGLHWPDGLAPSPGNNYFVGSGLNFRTPASGSATFLGDSLTLDAGSLFIFKTAGAITINNLILNGGTITNGDPGGDLIGRLNGNIKVTAPSAIDSSGGGARSFLINSLISGTESLAIQRSSSGTGAVTFTNAANNFTGPLIIRGTGVLVTATIGNGGIASTLGMATSAAGNLVFESGTLRINGAGGSTDRLFTLAGNAIIESSGSAPVVFTNTGAIGQSGTVARTLSLSGTNTGENIFNPVIGDGPAATGLIKTGSGTWIIPTANTYTGTTTVNTGILRITNSNALGANGSGQVIINGNTGGNGVLELSGGLTLTKNIRLDARQLATADIPHIRNTSGNNVIIGTLTANTGGSEYNIESAAAGSSLTINGNIDLSPVSGTRNLKLMGAGDGVLNGNFIGASQGGITSLIKQGTGKWTLNGTAGHNAATLIQGGTLAVSATGSLAGTNSIQISAGATLDVSAIGSLTMNAASSLGGAGTVAGSVVTSTGSTLSPGTSSAAGTLTINGNLSLVGGDTIVANFGSANTVGGGVNDLINVSGSLTSAGSTAIAFHPVGASVGGAYRLIQYAGPGTLGGTFTIQNNTRYVVVADTATAGQVNLNVSGSAADLTWTGSVDGNWDNNATANWSAGEKFFEADRVTFTDAATVKGINIIGSVLPGAMTVNTNTEYTFGGGAIGGGGNITKTGTGALVLNGANTFDGNVVINEGVVRIGNAAALGTTMGGVTIAANGALDVNTQTLPVGEVVTITGEGFGGLGAVVNSGATAGGLKKLVLAGNASIGGLQRWDIRDVPGGLDAAGHTLTKVGANEIFLKDLGETHLGGVVIKEGKLGFEGNTTFGDGAGVLKVEGQGGLAVFNYTANNTKAIELHGTISTPPGAGTGNVITSPIALSDSGTATVDLAASTNLALQGVISGTGDFSKFSTGVLELGGTQANTFTGTLNVNEGNVRLAKPAGVNAIGGDLVLNAGSVTFVNPEQIPDTATVTNNSAGNLVLVNETVANVVVATTGAGEVQAQNGVNVTEMLTINNGIYSQASSSSGAVGGVSLFTGGILRIAANSGSSTLSVGAEGISVLGGQIQVGHGTGEWDAVLNLGGDIVTEGDLLINDGGYNGEKLRQINLTGARTFEVGEFFTATVNADFGGVGSLTKAGEGTLLLTERSASTYTGPTAVNEGTMLVSGSLSGGEVTVAAAATLGGVGTINGNVVVNGTLLPGITTGTLTLGNTNLTLGSAANTTFELGLGSYDRIAGINSLTLDGKVNISLFEDFAPIGGEVFDLLDFTTINAAGFNVASDLVLPELSGGLSWDTTQFLTSGTLAVVPEPGTVTMLLLGAGFLGARRRRRAN